MRLRESLYIVMSDVERYLGDEPGRLAALRRALAEAPQSPVALYLLGSVLLAKGNISEAVKVLTEGVRLHSEHPRMAVSCAIAMFRNGAKVEECVAVLNLARNVGASDPYFISVFAGMLVLEGHLSEADAVWTKARQRSFAPAERDRVYFAPTEPDSAGWIAGRIAHVSPSFAFVKVAGYPDVYCGSKQVGYLALARDQRVEVRVGFSARGPQALELRIV